MIDAKSVGVYLGVLISKNFLLEYLFTVAPH